MDYWLHRISHIAELSYPLLDKGYLSIGFSEFTNETIIDKVMSDDWQYFNQQFNEEWGSTPRTRHNLWNFIKMKKGDIVIVPSWGTFFVCEVLDEKPLVMGHIHSEDLKTWHGESVYTNGKHLISKNGDVYDLGFARKVNVLHKHISREKFADARLTSRMKIRQGNALINDLKENIEKSIKNYSENKPIHLHSIIIDQTASVVLNSIQNELNPDKFEKLVKAYFQAIGANDVTIPSKNERDKEGDADIIAVFENIKLIIYIQAKFQNGQISEWGANQILDYKNNKESIDDGYNKIAWVITTANTFNSNAQNLAKENNIQLVNGIDFSKMILNSGINLLNTHL